MRDRLAAWWREQRRLGAVPGIVIGLLLSPVVAILVIHGFRPEPLRSTPSALSSQGRTQLAVWAAKAGPQAATFAYFARLRAEGLAKTPADELSEDELLEFAAWSSSWSEQFIKRFRAAIERVAVAEAIDPRLAQAFLSEQLRAVTGPCVSKASVLPAAVSAPRLGFLCSPVGRVPPGGLTPEEAITEAIAHLLQVLANLPPQSNGAQGVRNAILAHRRAIIAFDTTPITIAFNSPAEGALLSEIPSIEFAMTDAGSGPDPSSATLRAVNMSGGGSSDLTSFLTITVNDQVQGRVVVRTSGVPDAALPDGFLRLEASGTDNAANPSTTATRSIVLDRQPPSIAVTSPVPGSSVPPPSLFVVLTVSDMASGVDVASIRVLLDIVDITGSLTKTPGPPNALGAPNEVGLSGVVGVDIGSHVLHIRASDRAGNISTMDSSFSVTAFGEEVPILARDLRIEVLSGDGQSGLVGKLAADPLRARVFDGATRRPVPNLHLLFNIIEGGGAVVQDETLVTTSQEDGTVEARYIFGHGTNRVAVAFADEVPRIEFTLIGVLPKLSIESGPVRAEGPGNALVGLYELRVTKPDDTPLAGEVLEAFEIKPDGSLITDPTAQLGFFLPEVGITDSDGRVRFAYVVKPTSPPDTTLFFLFALPAFHDAAGKPVSFFPVLASTGHKFDPSVMSTGQAQVGKPEEGTIKPMTVKHFVLPDHHLVAAFEIGAAEPAKVGSLVVVVGTEVDSIIVDGKKILVVIEGAPTGVPGLEEAGVKFVPAKAGLAGFPALVKVEIGFKEVTPGAGAPVMTRAEMFAVGPPELHLVRKSFKRDSEGKVLLDAEGKPLVNTDPEGHELFERITHPDPFIREEMLVEKEGGGFETPTEQRRFFVELRLPPGETSAPEVELSSLNLRQAPLETPNGLAFTERKLPVELKPESESAEGRRSTFRTRPIVMTSGGSLDGTPTPLSSIETAGESVELVQGSRAGRASAKAKFAAAELQSDPTEYMVQRVIMIVVDGLKESWINDQIGALPGIRRIWGADGEKAGLLFGPGGNAGEDPDLRNRSVYPAVTYSAFATITTGELPGRHRFMGAEVFLRADRPENTPLNLKSVKDLLKKPTDPAKKSLLRIIGIEKLLSPRELKDMKELLGENALEDIIRAVEDLAPNLEDLPAPPRRHFAFLAESYLRVMDNVLQWSDDLDATILERRGSGEKVETMYRTFQTAMNKRSAVVTNFIAPVGPVVQWRRSATPGSQELTVEDLQTLATLEEAAGLARRLDMELPQQPDSSGGIEEAGVNEGTKLDNLGREAAKNLFKEVTNAQLPEVILIHFGGVDHAMHFVHAADTPTLDIKGKAYVSGVLDDRIRDVLDSIPKDILSSTAFILTADHGMYLVGRKNAISLKEFTAAIEDRPEAKPPVLDPDPLKFDLGDPWFVEPEFLPSGEKNPLNAPALGLELLLKDEPFPRKFRASVLNVDLIGAGSPSGVTLKFGEAVTAVFSGRAPLFARKIATVEDAVWSVDRGYQVALTASGSFIGIHIKGHRGRIPDAFDWDFRPDAIDVEDVATKIFQFYVPRGEKIDFILEPTPTGLNVLTPVVRDGKVVGLIREDAGASSKVSRELADFARFYRLDTPVLDRDAHVTRPAHMPDLIAVARFGATRDRRFYFSPARIFSGTHGHFMPDEDANIPLLVGVLDGKKKDELTGAVSKAVLARISARRRIHGLPVNLSDIRSIVHQLLTLEKK